MTSLVLAIGARVVTNTTRAFEITEGFVRSMLDDNHSLLSDDTLSDVERNEKFQAFFHTVTALDCGALFTLGLYTNTIERSDIAVFLNNFRASLISRVRQRLVALYDFSLSVTGLADRTVYDSVVVINVVSAERAGV